MPSDSEREAIIQELLAQLQAARTAIRVRVESDHFNSDWKIPAPMSSASTNAPELNEVEAAILAAFKDEKEKVVGEKLAERTVYQFSSQFRTALASMHRGRLLINHSPGFSRTSSGTAALEGYRSSHQELETE